jgi:hypothetical protein
MAVALSLLIVLPALGQTSGYDDTRGQLRSGDNLTVAVLSGVADDASTTAVDESISGSYFNGNLYVANKAPALNKVRINATAPIKQVELAGADGKLENRQALDSSTPPALVDTDDFNTVNVNEAAYENDNIACDAVATVRNNNTGRSIKVYLNDPTTASDITTTGLPDATGLTSPAAMNATFEVIASGDEKRDGWCSSPHRNASGGSSDTNPENGGTAGTAPVLADDGTVTTPGSSGHGVTLTDPAPERMGKIPARHGDTLTITVAGVSGSVTIVVDAEGPEFTEISPEHKAYVSSNTVKFRFVVTDSDSGLAHDGELDYSRGDNDARAFNTDGDGNITTEPRSETGGASRDIDVVVGTDKSASGSNGWRVRGGRPGVSYFLDMAVTDLEPGANPWHLMAKDRAGNSARTDADPNKDDPQDFALTVDVSSPEFRDARTGISYDAGKKTEVANRSYIAVTFEDANGRDAVKDVDHSKFLVEDAEVVGVIHLAEKSDCNNDDSDDDAPLDIDGRCLTSDLVPQSRIYLELAEALAPDATPLVSMFGGAALDLAGNPSNQHEVRAADNIAPAITVTLSTDVGDRPVIKNNGEVSISITSDEDLRRLPTVFFSKIVDGGKSTAEKQTAVLGALRRGERVSTDASGENAWSRTYNNGDVGGSDGLYAVIVIAEDDADNIGSTPGWGHKRSENTPQAAVNSGTRSVKIGDLEAAGLLVEVDTDLAAPTFSLAPETGDDTRTSESGNPFITIDFASEKGEYGDYVYKDDASAPEGKEKGDRIKNFGDSHSAVAITSITLNGNDVMDQTTRVSASTRTYTLAAQDLATGDYELKVTGRDDVGNEAKGTYEFEVAARAPYELDLTPGWNLVSLPGTPLDSSVGSVMGDSMQATIVLAYQDDAWLTAVNDGGTWRGTLTDIVGGYGYWVQTTAFESISALIPETDTSSVLPTANVIAGWNLLGVVDVRQGDPDDPPSGGGDPDDYFGNIAWKVAYSFDTSNNTWSKSIPAPKTTGESGIANGKGYWVWSTEAGTLVP